VGAPRAPGAHSIQEIQMNKLLSILLASTFAVAGTAALAADPPKDAPPKKTQAALEKPANVTAEAWAKMTDAEKAKAVEAAKGSKEAAAKPAKKEKKGGC
jgi:hypothetical protein